MKKQLVTIKFAGDSGDGIQLLGNRFTDNTALYGNDYATFPDFPAEIRAPAGTLAGVSGFQIQFGAQNVSTSGEKFDVLVAMNAAALKTNLKDLKDGAWVIANESGFSKKNLKLAGYESNPLEAIHDSEQFKLSIFDFSQLSINLLEDLDLEKKIKERGKNIFVLGMLLWAYDRDIKTVLDWLDHSFDKKPLLNQANQKLLKAGHYFAETNEILAEQFKIEKVIKEKGKYRNITGNQSLALGIITAAELSNRNAFFAGYPITPASDILHHLLKNNASGIQVFQAEDEIAAAGAALGAAYGGHIGVTASSGPGISLKSEMINLAVMTELPLVVIDVQRAGPSTGMPTKTEQSDLLMAMFGRNGESPLPVIAAQSSGDCFYAFLEASELAMRFMCPIILLSDAYLANGAEAWRVPDVSRLNYQWPPINETIEDFQPYKRNKELARPWVAPGVKGFAHRIGGLEKEQKTGNVSYEGENHEQMVHLRAQKIENIQNYIAPVPDLDPNAKLLVISWGSTYGAVCSAIESIPVDQIQHLHLRWLNPLPKGLINFCQHFDQILIPELNNGQLTKLIAAQINRAVVSHKQINGKPLDPERLASKIKMLLNE